MELTIKQRSDGAFISHAETKILRIRIQELENKILDLMEDNEKLTKGQTPCPNCKKTLK